MEEHFIIEFFEESRKDLILEDPLYKASCLLRAYIDLELSGYKDGVPLEYVAKELGYCGNIDRLIGAVVDDIIISGNKLSFTVRNNFSGLDITSLLAQKLGIDFKSACFRVQFDDGVKSEYHSMSISKEKPSLHKYSNIGKHQLCILEKPGYEFFMSFEQFFGTSKTDYILYDSSLNNNGLYNDYGRVLDLRKDGLSLFTIKEIDESDNGILVDISDNINLLDGVVAGRNTMFESLSACNPEHYVINGPFPVIDGDMVCDKLSERVNGLVNVRFDIGLEEEEGVSLSDIYDEVNKNHPDIYSNFSIEDCRLVAQEMSLEGYSGNICGEFCNRLDQRVSSKFDMYRQTNILDRFVSPTLHEASAYEGAFIDSCDSLLGIRKQKNGYLVASVDDYDVYIKQRDNNEPFISLLKDGHFMSFLYASQSDDIPVREIVSKAFQKAVKRDKALRKFESFKGKLGLSKKTLSHS